MTPAQRKKFDLENPRSQLFSKTDLAKFLNVWEEKPDKVSLGAQKNFAHFAHDIGQAWKKSEASFNEDFFKDIVSKAIIFKSTEKIVSSQTWYGGGYRANIVAYAIAKMAHDVAEMKLAVDFWSIWNRQIISAEMKEVLSHVAKAVHDVLVDTPPGIRNVTEWAKKQACWNRVEKLNVDWSKIFINALISKEEHKSRQNTGRKKQKVLNGIEAQTAIVTAGGQFWKHALEWGLGRKLLSERDVGLLKTAALIPAKLPSEKQARLIVEILSRLRLEGLEKKFP